MAKAKTRSKTAATRADRATARRAEHARADEAPVDPKPLVEEQEKPLPEADQRRTVADERLETDQTMRLDGTTPRHTEPLGPPAPGQQGRPGPERRVTPMNGIGPVSRESLDPSKARDGSDLGPVIRVTATRVGYIDHVRRRVGDVFDVREKQFTDSWMAPVDDRTPTKVTSAPQALKRAHDETLAERAGQKKTSTGDADRI